MSYARSSSRSGWSRRRRRRRESSKPRSRRSGPLSPAELATRSSWTYAGGRGPDAADVVTSLTRSPAHGRRPADDVEQSTSSGQREHRAAIRARRAATRGEFTLDARWRWTVSRVLFRHTLRCSGEDHSSRPAVADGLEHSDPDTLARSEEARYGRAALRWCPYSSLLREGFASPPVTRLSRVSSYLTISTLPLRRRSAQVGGVISVALSLRSPSVAVSHLPTRWSPDFPLPGAEARQRSSVHLQRAEYSWPEGAPEALVVSLGRGRSRAIVRVLARSCPSASR